MIEKTELWAKSFWFDLSNFKKMKVMFYKGVYTVTNSLQSTNNLI